MLTCGSKYADVIIMCVCFFLGPTACIGDPRTHRQGFLMSSNSMLKNINFQGADLGRAASEGTLCGPVTLNQYRIRCVLCYSRGDRRGAPYLLLPTPPACPPPAAAAEPVDGSPPPEHPLEYVAKLPGLC